MSNLEYLQIFLQLFLDRGNPYSTAAWIFLGFLILAILTGAGNTSIEFKGGYTPSDTGRKKSPSKFARIAKHILIFLGILLLLILIAVLFIMNKYQ